MDIDCGSARDRLGRTLGGKYHLKSIVGAGGTAVVYRATTPDGQMVAVKILHDHLSRHEEVCRRFVREGQLGNVLDHPGVVKVLDHGETEEGSPYLVLEYLEGESLEERRVRAGGRLDMWETLDFCDQLLAVLEVAHAKNIIHRDIKPSNLFLTKSGVLKVLDFGIARLTDDNSATATKTGQMVGTPAFMPPEQALSRPRDVDARTDIWSVGATLFTLLSGEHVHIAETSSEHLVKAATLHARSLARALPGVPANVEALVARCLAFDKNDRWPSATAMRQELAHVRDDPGRRIGTSTSPPPERTPSSPNLPTFVGPRSSVPSFHDLNALAASGDRNSDTNMSLTSNPGVYDMFRPRRRWLLPFAVASSVLLVVMSALVLMLAVRTTNPSQAAMSQTTANKPGAANVPPSVDDAVAIATGGATATPDPAPVVERPPAETPRPAAPPRPTTATASTTKSTSSASTSKPSAALFSASTSTAAPASKQSASFVAKKPSATSPSRKDVYRPF
jgi:serine/threonine-protein kinase